eukprot:gnl/TRDRNA2_/TRDRNA2_201164_c0_seq1.p1 gnl/TRDRNA2_/TRDRNA2_201164_c0~~gnl/TRDRNA2_/TRDRNA2_201164_c0_seq1.p1  ORF type:complete len:236 (+),score=12.76 gnl/TRDRNA2_/TRDRNA2_201164_c0_seq1:9-716(+)
MASFSSTVYVVACLGAVSFQAYGIYLVGFQWFLAFYRTAVIVALCFGHFSRSATAVRAAVLAPLIWYTAAPAIMQLQPQPKFHAQMFHVKNIPFMLAVLLTAKAYHGPEAPRSREKVRTPLLQIFSLVYMACFAYVAYKHTDKCQQLSRGETWNNYVGAYYGGTLVSFLYGHFSGSGTAARAGGLIATINHCWSAYAQWPEFDSHGKSAIGWTLLMASSYAYHSYKSETATDKKD